MQQENSEIIIIVSTAIIFLITFALIILFSIFQKRKNFLLLEQKNAKEDFEREITETQIEIREETLRNISWELHDNIGQLLTLAKIQIQNTSKESLEEVSKTIGKSLEEIRSLSKLINPEAINEIKLKNAIQLEVDRFNRLNFIKSTLRTIGKKRDLDSKSEIIIFRILQEFFTNTIKHSKASDLDVCLEYKTNKLNITVKDNGVGFNKNQLKNEKGIGLINMENRAKLIGVELNLSSEINKGTTLEISYKF